jgi:hypothetical protein
VFPSYEAIIEALNGPDIPWDNIHHISYFLPKLRRIEVGELMLTITGDGSCPVNPLATHIVYVEVNMESIIEIIPIDISRTPGITENIFIATDSSPEEVRIYIDLFKEFDNAFSWSYEEMLGIDPRIVEHEITTYPDAKMV